MLILEMTSIALITLLMIIVLATHPGGVFNHDELTLHGLSFHTILLGGTLTIFAIPGVEAVGERGIRFELPTMVEAIRCFKAVTVLAAASVEETYG